MVARNPYFESIWGGNNLYEGLGLLSGGLTNVFLSPSQTIGFAGDLLGGDNFQDAYYRYQLLRNSGVVTDKFAEEHPDVAVGANFAVDLLTPGILYGAGRGLTRGYRLATTPVEYTGTAFPSPKANRFIFGSETSPTGIGMYSKTGGGKYYIEKMGYPDGYYGSVGWKRTGI